MKFQASVIREQGVDFVIVVVKKNVVDNRNAAQGAMASFSPAFPQLPIVLMAQEHNGRPVFFGRDDIVRFLSNVPVEAIPWREYTVN